MKIATLGIVTRGDMLLLGEKKRGEIGTGVLSGGGGKLEVGETLIDCLLRENEEEFGILLNPASAKLVARIDFYAEGTIDFRVYTYLAKILFGKPKETSEMIPGWYPRNNPPYDRMYESDRYWFPKAVRGEKFNANVYYRSRARDFDRIEFLPFTTKRAE